MSAKTVQMCRQTPAAKVTDLFWSGSLRSFSAPFPRKLPDASFPVLATLTQTPSLVLPANGSDATVTGSAFKLVLKTFNHVLMDTSKACSLVTAAACLANQNGTFQLEAGLKSAPPIRLGKCFPGRSPFFKEKTKKRGRRGNGDGGSRGGD